VLAGVLAGIAWRFTRISLAVVLNPVRSKPVSCSNGEFQAFSNHGAMVTNITPSTEKVKSENGTQRPKTTHVPARKPE